MAFLVQSLLSNPGIPLQARQEALDRVLSDPGLPTPNPTSSFWLRSPHPDLTEIHSPKLPVEADVVIIGSGVTGTSIARTLLESRKPRNNDLGQEPAHRPAIVMLEARDICSGATGRNGGHILETAEEFADLEEAPGTDAARKILRFRLAHLRELLAVAEQYGLTKTAQARKVQFLSVYSNQKRWSEARGRFQRLKEGLPEETKEWRLYAKEDIPKEFSLPYAQGIVAGPAGAIWPYKFITGVLGHLKVKYPDELRIETNTPVTNIEDHRRKAPDGLRYTLTTPRGIIRARHVVHCTNAHVAHLVPGMKGLICPVRGQMSAQHPGVKFRTQGVEHSWLFNYDRGFDYLTQLPPSPSDAGEMMMFGGGFSQSEGSGISDLGVSTDSELSLYADIHLSGALSAVFGHENWGAVPVRAVEQMWTGIMGFSADGFPWVGRLPGSLARRSQDAQEGRSAEWVSAAFSGEGMVLAWLCGKALGMMLLGDDNNLLTGGEAVDLSWFPEQMLITEERATKVAHAFSVPDVSPHL
ncbi:hypothetical protein KXX16_001335 [Aspergillus fumigatus]|uniref:FAD dependent oxidoreductase, putative n=1 Tax=Aspergillus fumigatus (strain CBS 144.89 / FGSC A1163 / CEA10) TaxID=451804 RepID=B0Y172_ASPFC|nr:FAD dependent oxidoreductase, putative [Aspergillus fumigatus A1163]KAF4286789.1 hypothetical protein CNMCM8689_001918 [Aspergillus fumigatus]KAH1272484.1 hypothetical protein KXX45_009211 [Aspergillus fumigatus]KAH1282205.1 hypothetical protein KXX48_003281 [Aspergillus fumigatus]KAH1319399.1 hypothetical protein KXX66_004052 [Aspergillus fumigatus]